MNRDTSPRPSPRSGEGGYPNAQRLARPTHSDSAQPRPAEEVLAEETLVIERKKFQITRRKNPRGQFLKITEESGGHRNSVIVPLEGFEDFMEALDRVVPPQPSQA